jgi:hypothetical protein
MLAGCGGTEKKATAGAGDLNGLFKIAQGVCAAERATGSSFRMVQPGGTLASGPFVPNGDSPCADKTWTPLGAGRDGGLRTGAFQSQTAPPFDGQGNATSDGITQPQRWFAVAFGLATNAHDPQTNKTTPVPRIRLAGSVLTGDLSSLAATWNGQHFNQGAPKPGGENPGATSGPRGTFDPSTKAYTLDWTSQIAGGPFDKFTGIWHLEGVFQPA